MLVEGTVFGQISSFRVFTRSFHYYIRLVHTRKKWTLTLSMHTSVLYCLYNPKLKVYYCGLKIQKIQNIYRLSPTFHLFVLQCQPDTSGQTWCGCRANGRTGTVVWRPLAFHSCLGVWDFHKTMQITSLLTCIICQAGSCSTTTETISQHTL